MNDIKAFRWPACYYSRCKINHVMYTDYQHYSKMHCQTTWIGFWTRIRQTVLFLSRFGMFSFSPTAQGRGELVRIKDVLSADVWFVSCIQTFQNFQKFNSNQTSIRSFFDKYYDGIINKFRRSEIQGIYRMWN